MDYDSFLELVKKRRSIHRFKSDPVPDEHIDRIIEAARWAPSGFNLQPWEFVVVRNQESKNRLAEASWGQNFVSTAPVIVVVCSNLNIISKAYGERGSSVYSMQDTAAATENLILAAWNFGIGSCWVGSFNERMAKEILVLPNHVRPLAIVPLGYPATKPVKHERKKLEEVVHKDYF